MPPVPDTPLFIGIDVGSVSTNIAVLDRSGAVRDAAYVRTGGDPVTAIRAGLRELVTDGWRWANVAGCGATGSARRLAGALFSSMSFLLERVSCFYGNHRPVDPLEATASRRSSGRGARSAVVDWLRRPDATKMRCFPETSDLSTGRRRARWSARLSPITA